MPQRGLNLGIDLGGSKILAVVFDHDGKEVGRSKRKTKAERGYDAVLERVADTAVEAAEEAQVPLAALKTVGMAVPGPVDARRDRVVACANLGWGAKEVGRDLTKLLGVKRVVLGNDANLGALGEMAYGCGRGADSAFAFFVGTGLGAGCVVGGRVLDGAHGLAGEIGHLRAPFGDAVCGCGQRGCLETVVAKSGMARWMKASIKSGAACKLKALDDLRSGDLVQALEAGCKLTRTAIQRAAEGLAWGVTAAAAAVDPQCFIFGGGIMEALGRDILPLIREALKQHVFFDRVLKWDLRLAKLGDLSVAAGAARAAETAS